LSKAGYSAKKDKCILAGIGEDGIGDEYSSAHYRTVG
jgi:hypothetical protein